jgi:hypothetical protein
LDSISILVEPKAVLLAKSRLEDGSLKRSDRKKNPPAERLGGRATAKTV